MARLGEMRLLNRCIALIWGAVLATEIILANGSTAYDTDQMIHFSGEGVIDFELVRRFYHVIAVLFFR